MKEARLLELKPITMARLKELRRIVETAGTYTSLFVASRLEEALDEIERLSWEQEMGDR